MHSLFSTWFSICEREKSERGKIPSYLTVFLMLMLLTTGPAWAKVTAFEILKITSPAFDEAQFGETGTYERIDAVAHFSIDPESAHAQQIVDLDKAPVDEKGLIRYSTDVSILRPTDASKGSGVLFYEVPNRGRALSMTLMNLAEGSAIPATWDDVGDGFLMRQGYTLVWSGWQADIAEDSINIQLPVIPDVQGLSREEFVFDNADPVVTATLSYPAVDTSDSSDARLSVRLRPTDPRSTASDLSFRFLSDREIEITRPSQLDAGAIYEFIYTAHSPTPAGLGFHATSDLISFLRGNSGHEVESPMGDIKHTISLGISQSGRYLRDFIYQGFNADETGARVFDGAMPFIAGSRKTFTNYRFAQPGRYSRQHEDHDFPGDQFPFSYAQTSDPLTGKTDSILSKCSANDTCPLIMHADSSTEFWQARAALVSTSPDGKPLSMPDSVRLYFMAGLPHFTSWTAMSSSSEMCSFPSNPLSASPVMRSLLTSMRAWLSDDTAPPESRYPSVSDGTLVSLAELELPEVADTALIPVYNVLQVRNYSTTPPTGGASYPVWVPQLNKDGIPEGGIHVPEIALPLGTYWGWNLRNAGFASGELCGLSGSFLAFSSAANHSDNDSRKSLAERYTDSESYSIAVGKSAEALVNESLMLSEDVDVVRQSAALRYEHLQQQQ